MRVCVISITIFSHVQLQQKKKCGEAFFTIRVGTSIHPLRKVNIANQGKLECPIDFKL